MKSNFAVFIVFSLLLVANFSCARKDLGGYWDNTMKGQPMPQAIKDLIGDPQASYAGKDRFIRDFDVKPNVILYHTHVVPMKEKHKPLAKNQV
ncbi:uncharacterized protein LOC113865912 [Abrus precatorius]|uniref:Uncharacterized protein LOC113865912 n=1 Tax=Abrus precatorius TaxID=3816 RepID=A0A8B8LKL7_ABRPR|nr:uncharacterized protein LOC113865912 [Abrus precatorius]